MCMCVCLFFYSRKDLISFIAVSIIIQKKREEIYKQIKNGYVYFELTFYLL
jgi:hypothetical protein